MMTAKEALAIASDNTKYPIEQILDKIADAAAKGNTHIYIATMSDGVRDILTSLGYSTWKDDGFHRAFISWGSRKLSTKAKNTDANTYVSSGAQAVEGAGV